MSALTKVFIVLVSVLAIFLCGVVLVFVLNTEHWQEAYQDQELLAQAAQVQAVTAENSLRRETERYAAMNQRLQDNILALQKEKSDLTQRWTTEAQARAQAERTKDTALTTMETLQQTVQDMYATQQVIQDKLDEAHTEMRTARAQLIDVERKLNDVQVQRNQLESIRRRNQEKIAALENELAQINQALQEVRLTSKDVQADEDQVASVTPAEAVGVPIRGKIMEIQDSLASISVGGSSGVRENMTFRIVRGGNYLGDLVVTYVEPGQAGGRIVNRRGMVVSGDRVTTGFD